MPKRDNTTAASHGLNPDEHRNAGNGRVFVPIPPGFLKAGGKGYIKDKAAPRGRYTYRYMADEFKQTGRVADPHTEVVHHTTEPYDTHQFSAAKDRQVAIESRKVHYGQQHGRPFSRPGGKAPKARSL